MNQEINHILIQHEKDINRISNQRRLWSYASSVVVCVLIFLIFGWDWLSTLTSKKLWWVIVSLMIIISINWWYWTMRVIRIILKYQHIEYDLLKSILYDVQTIRVEIRDLTNQVFDKRK